MRIAPLSAALVAALGFVGLAFAQPLQAQSSPTLLPPEDGSAWMWDQSLERVMGQLRVRSITGGGYPPQQRCAMAVVSRDGEVSGYVVAEEAVEVEEGMSGARACEPLLKGQAQEVLPGADTFMEGEYLTPMPLMLTPDFFYEGGSQVDGYMLADEINAWAPMGAKPEEEILPGRIADPNTVWQALVIFFLPAEAAFEFEDAWASGDWQARPLIIDLHPERMGR